MRIGLDARALTHPQPGGFKTYVRGLVDGLAATLAGHHLVAYTNRPADTPADTDIVTWRVVAGTAPLVGAAWREQVRLVAALRRDHLDVFHAPCNTAPLLSGVPLVLTLHDTIWRHPRPWGAGARAALMDRYTAGVATRAARRAAAVLTVSQASRRALCAELPFLDPRRVLVAPNAPRPCFGPVPAEVRRATLDAQALDPGFVLALASADPRKNLPTLLEAFARLPASTRRRHPLVAVWAHPALAESAASSCAQLGIAGEVRFLYAVPDAALAALYGSAAVFAFPSLSEGFGLPILEAMACGAPVVAGQDPAVRETAGDAAEIVDVSDAAALGAALERLLGDERLRADLASRGNARAVQFSWQASALRTLEAYELATGS